MIFWISAPKESFDLHMLSFFLRDTASRPAGLPRYALVPSTPGWLGYKRGEPSMVLEKTIRILFVFRMKKQHEIV